MASPPSPRISGRTLLLGTMAVYGIVLAAVFRNDWMSGGLSFSPQGVMNVGSTVAPLFAISAFVERAVEIVVTATRGPGATVLQRRFDHAANAGSGAAREEAERRVDDYKLHTQRLSFLVALGLGLFASVVGVRAIAPLLAPSVQEHRWFDLFDVTLTSLLLAGGSEGIHQVVTTVTTFLDSSKSRQKAATAATEGPPPVP